MDDHFDIGRVFEIGKFDITRLTCNLKNVNIWGKKISYESFTCIHMKYYA